MVAPVIIAAGIAGGASLLGSFMNNRAAGDAADEQQETARLNFIQQQRQQQWYQDLVEQMRGEEKLGTTDQYGTTTRYVEGQGWVTDTPQSIDNILNAGLSQEQYNRSAGELQRREALGFGADARRDEDSVADALMQEFRRATPESENDIYQQLIAQGSGERNRVVDAISDNNARVSLRRGESSDIGDIISSSARASGEAARDAGVDATLRAKEYVGAEFDNRRGNLANLYNSFRSRSTAPGGVGYQAPRIQAPQQSNSQGSLYAAGLARGAPQLDYQQPNYVTGNTVSQVGGTLADLWQAYNQQGGEGVTGAGTQPKWKAPSSFNTTGLRSAQGY